MPQTSNYPPATIATEVTVGLTAEQVEQAIRDYLANNGYQTGAERDSAVQAFLEDIAVNANAEGIIERAFSSLEYPDLNSNEAWELGGRTLQTNLSSLENMPDDIDLDAIETPHMSLFVVGRNQGNQRTQIMKLWDEGAGLTDRFYVAFRSADITGGFSGTPDSTSITQWRTFEIGGVGAKGDQGFQGKFRIHLYSYTAHNDTPPSTPTGAAYDSETETIESIPADWQADFPSSQASQPDTFDVYEAFAVFNPANPSVALNWSSPFKIDSEVGPPGPAGQDGQDGQDGLRGAQGERGLQGERGQDGVAGQDGRGVPTGGEAGQSLVKVTSNDYDTEWRTITGGGGTPSNGTAYHNVRTGTSASITLSSQEAQAQFVLLEISGSGVTGGVNTVIMTAERLQSDITDIRLNGAGRVNYTASTNTLTITEISPISWQLVATSGGPEGERGARGEPGQDGQQGERGQQGVQGIQGIQGERGLQGERGQDGQPGEKGDTGDTGQGVPAGGSANQVLAKIDGVDYNTRWVNPPSGGGGGTDNTAEIEALESRLNNISHQAVSITGVESNPINFAANQTDTLSATVNLAQGLHTIYSDSDNVIATITRESDGAEFAVVDDSAFRIGDRIAVKVNVPSAGDYAALGGTAQGGLENIGGAPVDGVDLRTALANARDGGSGANLPEVIQDFFDEAVPVHSSGAFIEHEDWSLVKEVTFLGTSPYTATEYGDTNVTVTYSDTNVGHYIAMPNAGTHLLVGIEPRSYDNGDVYGYIARSGQDLTDHLAVPLLAINASGHYTVGTGVNTSFEAAYQTIQDQFGDVSAQSGDQIVLAYLPPSSNAETGRVLAVIRRSDGTIIESNDDSIVINYQHPFDSILIHPSETSVVKVARHDSNSITHDAVGTLVRDNPTSNYTAGDNFSIVYGLGTQGAGQDYVDIKENVRFSGTITDADGSPFTGEQGAQGRFEVALFNFVAHNATAPTTPVGVTYDGTSFSNVPSGWSADFPSTQAQDPDNFDVYRSFATYDPSDTSTALVFSVPYKIDADQGIQGIQGERGERGLQGIQGERGADGTDGTDGADGQGVPVGGSAGQILSKIDGTDYNTQWINPPSGTGTASVPYFISIATAAERFNITNTQLQVGGIMYARDTQVFYILGYDSGEDEYFTNLVPTGDVRILDSGTTLSTVSTNQIVKVQAGTYAGRVFTPTFDQSNVSTATDFSVTLRWTELGGGSGGERNFTSLTDTPTTYSGQGGQIVAVNTDEDGLEFVARPADGQDGQDGAPGARGERGEQGIQGIQGIQGEQGEKGDAGNPGAPGEQGQRGEQGQQGIQGEQGSQGRYRVFLFRAVTHGTAAPTAPSASYDGTSFSGISTGWVSTFPSTQAGDPDNFDVYESFAIYDPVSPASVLSFVVPFKIDADQGIQGEQGERGLQGIQGEKGDKGDTGDTGARGEQGERGLQGQQGIQGVQGQQGEKGQDGADGAPGERGLQGEAGQGVPVGGSADQVLTKIDGTDYNTEWRDAGTSNVGDFTDLGDTPNTLGAAGSFVSVNTDGTGLVFVGAPTTAEEQELTVTSGSATLPANYATYQSLWVATNTGDRPSQSWTTRYLASFTGNTNYTVRVQGQTDITWNPETRVLSSLGETITFAVLIPKSTGARGADGQDGQDGARGEQGAAGERRLYFYRQLTAGSNRPAPPSNVQYDGTTYTNLPSVWSTLFPIQSVVDDDSIDIFECFADYNPADGNVTLNFSSVYNLQGERGIQGIQGERGLQGEQGVQGVQGVKGEKGDQGEQGVRGFTGDDGADGTTVFADWQTLTASSGKTYNLPSGRTINDINLLSITTGSSTSGDTNTVRLPLGFTNLTVADGAVLSSASSTATSLTFTGSATIADVAVQFLGNTTAGGLARNVEGTGVDPVESISVFRDDSFGSRAERGIQLPSNYADIEETHLSFTARGITGGEFGSQTLYVPLSELGNEDKIGSYVYGITTVGFICARWEAATRRLYLVEDGVFTNFPEIDIGRFPSDGFAVRVSNIGVTNNPNFRLITFPEVSSVSGRLLDRGGSQLQVSYELSDDYYVLDGSVTVNFGPETGNTRRTYPFSSIASGIFGSGDGQSVGGIFYNLSSGGNTRQILIVRLSRDNGDGTSTIISTRDVTFTINNPSGTSEDDSTDDNNDEGASGGQ